MSDFQHRFELRRDGDKDFTCAPRSDWQPGWDVIERMDTDLKHAVPCVAYKLDGQTCVVIAGPDDHVSNEVAALEILRLALSVAKLQRERDALVACLERNVEQVEGCAANHYPEEPEYCQPQCVDEARALLARLKEDAR